MRIARLFLLALISVLTGVPSRACSCSAVTPICASFAHHTLIFRGTVTESVRQPLKTESVHNLDGTTSTVYIGPAASNVRFSVAEGFRGTTGQSEITLVDSGPCNYPFEVGKQYLVFADEWNGTLGTGSCSGNRLLKDPDLDEDVRWMRNYATSPSGTRIFGAVILPDRQPASNVAVSVKGAATAEVLTDKNGRYSITTLPPGEYTAAVAAPSGFISNGRSTSFTVQDRSCAQQDFPLAYDSHVRGRVTDGDGNPVGQVSVQLQPTGSSAHDNAIPSRLATTAADGRYDLDRVFPGEYLVRVNEFSRPETPYPSRFYGGDALNGVPITVTASATLDDIDIALPKPWTAVRVLFKVINADGQPVPGARVDHIDVSNRHRALADSMTSADGTVTLSLFTDHMYDVMALQSGGMQNRCSPLRHVTVTAETLSFELQLEREPGECHLPR